MTVICRLCLRRSVKMIPLFEAYIGEKLLTEIILSTLGIELDCNMDLDQVCRSCFNKVDLLYEFCEKLIETQSILSQWKRKGDDKSQEKSGDHDGTEDNRNLIVPMESIVEKTTQESSSDHDGTEDNNLIVPMESIVETTRNCEVSNVVNDEQATLTHEQRIEHEPIVIKQEPLKSGVEEVDETTTPSYDTERVKPNPPKRRKRKRCSYIVLKIPNKCYICSVILQSEDEFNEHIESHKEMLPYTCSQCSTSTKPIILLNLSRLNGHFESHNFHYTCRLCPLRFRTSNLLSYHNQTVHQSETSKHICDTCGREFSNSFLLKKHKLVHLYLNTQRYKCEICQKLFTAKYLLQRHTSSHSRQDRFKCEWCDDKFDSLDSCLAHKTVCAPSRAVCKICGKEFSEGVLLRRHERDHQSLITQRYKCEICQKLFTLKHCLRRHVAVCARKTNASTK